MALEKCSVIDSAGAKSLIGPFSVGERLLTNCFIGSDAIIVDRIECAASL